MVNLIIEKLNSHTKVARPTNIFLDTNATNELVEEDDLEDLLVKAYKAQKWQEFSFLMEKFYKLDENQCFFILDKILTKYGDIVREVCKEICYILKMLKQSNLPNVT